MITLIENNKRGIKTILVATDFSEPSDVALHIAIDLARQQNANIYLLHVLRPRETENKGEMMQRQIAKFPDAKSVEIVPLIRTKPYEEILKTQKEKDIDFIVIAGHGKKRAPAHPFSKPNREDQEESAMFCARNRGLIEGFVITYLRTR